MTSGVTAVNILSHFSKSNACKNKIATSKVENEVLQYIQAQKKADLTAVGVVLDNKGHGGVDQG